MAHIGFSYDDSFLRHVDPSGTHPESPQRISSVVEGLKSSSWWDRLEIIQPRLATIEELTKAHDANYIKSLDKILSSKSSGWLDPDTYYSPYTQTAAFTAAAGVTDLVEKVWKHDFDAGLALVRPPGHHAESDTAMGFCLINNVAVAAANLIDKGVDRIAILDFDVHHGNGTQHIFYNNPHVLYLSMHQWPLYPGTGWIDEVGAKDGTGYTVNLPIPPHCGDDEWLNLLHRIIAPVLFEYMPKIIILSSGFDAHRLDMISSQHMSDQGFSNLIMSMVQIAASVSNGRIVFVLEGGYVPSVILHGVKSFLGSVDSHATEYNRPMVPNLSAASPLKDKLNSIINQHKEFWKEVG